MNLFRSVETWVALPTWAGRQPRYFEGAGHGVRAVYTQGVRRVKRVTGAPAGPPGPAQFAS